MQLLLVSSSRCHPHGYLDHCAGEMQQLFSTTDEILFVPYARPGGQSHEQYTAVARQRYNETGLNLRGIHEFADPQAAVADAHGVFIGGGNTFVLLQALYELELISPLREQIVAGMPYMGTSAGSNVAGLSIGTSNDMPIVCPPSFDALGVIGCNLNPHYPHARPDPTHNGETRDDRIREFHTFNQQPVIALHEDGMLRVDGPEFRLIGQRDALLFQANRDVQSISPGPIPQDVLKASEP